MLSLRSGRYPTADNEAAVTQIGRGTRRHRGRLDDRPRWCRADCGRHRREPQRSRRGLRTGDPVGTGRNPTRWRCSSTPTTNASTRSAHRERTGALCRLVAMCSEDVMAAVLVLVVTTLALFLVGLIAAASFTVIAQRRLPQLGMMSAIGATEKHLRLTMLASGAVTGSVAAVFGAVIGVVGLDPCRAEHGIGRRVSDRPAQRAMGARRRHHAARGCVHRRRPRGGLAGRSRGSPPCSPCRVAHRTRHRCIAHRPSPSCSSRSGWSVW